MTRYWITAEAFPPSESTVDTARAAGAAAIIHADQNAEGGLVLPRWAHDAGATSLGVFDHDDTAPGPDTVAQLIDAARAALDVTDLVAIRCFKAAIPFPSEWQSYVVELRKVVAGTRGDLPEQPAYPDGA